LSRHRIWLELSLAAEDKRRYVERLMPQFT
jgi:hypothetical protein